MPRKVKPASSNGQRRTNHSFTFAFAPQMWQLSPSSELKKVMRPVYVIAGGITKFAKANPTSDFRLMVKESFDHALADCGGKLTPADIDGSVISYFSDHFTYQLKAGAMVQDYCGLCPKPHVRIEGGGATGGVCFQQAGESVASDRFYVSATKCFQASRP